MSDSGQPLREEIPGNCSGDVREDVPGERQEPEGYPTFSKEDVQALCAMGIPEPLAEQALFVTGSRSLESAAAWYFDGQDEEKWLRDASQIDIDRQEEEEMLRRAGQIDNLIESDEFKMMLHVPNSKLKMGKGKIAAQVDTASAVDVFKMVFVVNSELKMGKGKIAAQVAHACLGLYRNLMKDQAYVQQLLQWETVGETKIVLSGVNAKHLADLQRRSLAASLPSQLIQDAGRTEVFSKIIACQTI